jgi:hypothetical protein
MDDFERLPTVRFLNTDCTVMKHRYQNGRVALSLIDEEGPVATATINLPDAELGKNEILVEDWAENRNMLQALIEAGVVKPTGRTIRWGFVDVPVYELLGPFREASHAEGVEQGRGKGRVR